MSARESIQTVIGLSFLGCGWVFASIGVILLPQWLLFKISQWAGQVHSAPLDLYGMVGAGSLVFGVTCFLIACWLLAADRTCSTESKSHGETGHRQA